ncbi:serpin family protein [Collinsella intestinalis]|uniref:serpin family protein n=1 Tax=Collinsella intestinalis TaxID=147207 RepID=UPI0025A45738|nr:serpin family protein [Collinsella intestinalis]MDM8162788.1 serpin family protein [Collinsella intestinalis]
MRTFPSCPRVSAPAIGRRRLVQLAALAGGAAVLPAWLAGCGGAPALALTATDLTASAREASPSVSAEDAFETLGNDDARAASFTLTARLIQACSAKDRSRDPGANTFISPLSIAYALALAQNGAAGTTLDEIERVTGLATDELNAFLGAYARYLQTGDLWGDEGSAASDGAMPLHLANSVWMRESDTLDVRDDYLTTCARELDASVFSAPFDGSTVDDINAWVDEHTAHMIDRLINEIPDDARLYLINALAFEDTWEDPYEDADVEDDTFTCEDGLEQDIGLMRSREGAYLENEQFQGFIKPYTDYRFAFVGLLPRERGALADAVAALDGPALEALLQPLANAEANAGLPKFRLSYGTELTDALRALGMDAAFDALQADFTPLGTDEEGPLYIGQVLHKTFIDVNEEGTRAAAATSVGIETSAAAPMEEPVVYDVILDRPFAYLIIDYQLGIPVFAGTMQAIPDA